ncbi:MAG: hypothetical protein OXB94_05145 [Nitrospira sp.]|nr:hypothetical protein [Nitrospira sp.]
MRTTKPITISLPTNILRETERNPAIPAGSYRESGVLSSKSPPSEAFLLTYLQNVAIWK